MATTARLVSTTSHPSARAARIRPARPSPGHRAPRQRGRRHLTDRDLHHARGPTEHVLDPDVLDGVPRLGDGGEQPAELAGLVGHCDRHDGCRRRAGTVLARHAIAPGVAPAQGLGQDVLAALVDAAQGVEQRVEVSPQRSQDGSHRGRVRRQDLDPQVGVRGGDPGHVPQALARDRHDGVRRVQQSGGQQRGQDLRRVRDHGHGAVVLAAGITMGSARAARASSWTASTAASSAPGCGVITHGRSSMRSARAAAGPDTSRPAIGWPPTYREASTPAATSARWIGTFTEATSVTTAPGNRRSASATAAAVTAGGTATHHQGPGSRWRAWLPPSTLHGATAPPRRGPRPPRPHPGPGPPATPPHPVGAGTAPGTFR